jgi:hypothetical protein
MFARLIGLRLLAGGGWLLWYLSLKQRFGERY